MSINKRLFSIALIGLGISFAASTGFAQDAAAIDPDGPAGYLRSQATFGGAFVLFSYFFGLALSGFGAAMGLGRAVSAALDNIGRQPEAADKIQGAMIIGCALIEALTIYMLISPFLALFAGLTITAG